MRNRIGTKMVTYPPVKQIFFLSLRHGAAEDHSVQAPPLAASKGLSATSLRTPFFGIRCHSILQSILPVLLGGALHISFAFRRACVLCVLCALSRHFALPPLNLKRILARQGLGCGSGSSPLSVGSANGTKREAHTDVNKTT